MRCRVGVHAWDDNRLCVAIGKEGSVEESSRQL
jgi:hypothetical protein